MKIITPVLLTIIAFIVVINSTAHAQPYGRGIYNADVPYGDETSLSIATDGDVSIEITPTVEGILSTGTSKVTVTSTDVEGYKLYIRALDNTSMENLGYLLPASSNQSPASLTMNTWGYNTDASNNFIGITLDNKLIHSIATPVKEGDITTVTYGVMLDMAKPAGNYVADIVYTATPQTH
jgi:hypothetical protein